MYVIRQIRSFYGPSEQKSLVLNESGQRALKFSDRTEAQRYISEVLESGRYDLAHNESGRPEYKILRAENLPQYLSYYL